MCKKQKKYCSACAAALCIDCIKYVLNTEAIGSTPHCTSCIKELREKGQTVITIEPELKYIDRRPTFNDSYLQKLHPCPEFDPFIAFDEPRHIYTVDGEEWRGSVTGFIHSFFPEFDEDGVIAKMMASHNWPRSRYYGMTAEEIKALWEKIRNTACELGTEMHAYIEYFYNARTVVEQQLIINEYRTREFDLFLRFHNNCVQHLRPWRTELRVFDRQLQLAGSVDMLYLSPYHTEEQPRLIMYDWKRSKKIEYHNPYANGKGPVSHLSDSNFWHYSLQLNVYKQLIERNTRWRVDSMWLGVFHPNQPDYRSIQVQDLTEEVQRMFEMRRLELDPDAHSETDLVHQLLQCVNL